jgi:hypothetical protein
LAQELVSTLRKISNLPCQISVVYNVVSQGLGINSHNKILQRHWNLYSQQKNKHIRYQLNAQPNCVERSAFNLQRHSNLYSQQKNKHVRYQLNAQPNCVVEAMSVLIG